MDLKHLQQFQDGADNTKAERVRRQQLSKGISRMWQVLTVTYSPPYWLRGASVIEIFDKVWKGMETMSGKTCKLGFLFLYNLLSGRLRVRICGGNDSHRLATLVSQLYFDRKEKSMMNSVVNVLIRNPAFCARLPRFKDTRKMSRVPRFNGWTDDREPVSPLHNLFQALVPQLREYGDMKIVRYPPPPPHPTLALPLCEYSIPKYNPRDWVKPQVGDFSCEKRDFREIKLDTIVSLSKRCEYVLGQAGRRLNEPVHVTSFEHLSQVFQTAVVRQCSRMFCRSLMF